MRETMWIAIRTKKLTDRIEALKEKAMKCYGWKLSDIHFNPGEFKHNDCWNYQAFFTVTNSTEPV